MQIGQERNATLNE